MRPRKKHSNLPPCVYRKHGAYYYVKGGKWRRLGTDLRSALQEHARLLTQPKGGMAELIETALPIITRNVKENTAKQYVIACRKLQRIFIEFAPHEVLPKDVAKMKRELAGTPNMTNRCLTVLRLVFDYAVEEQIVDSNPCVGIKRLEEKARDRLIEHDEFQRIYNAAPPRLQCMMRIAYITGQRIMDVVNIPRSKISEEGIEFKAQKTGKKLIVRWTPELRSEVERAKALSGKVSGLYLFLATKGETRGQPPKYKTIRNQWKAACQAAGITDTTMRDIRAMAATNAEAQGKNATALLDHSSPQTTRRYLRGRKANTVEGASFRQSLDDSEQQ